MRIDSLAELQAFAGIFLKTHSHGGVFGLWGDLGSGKTTFVRECVGIICQSMKQAAPRVISPSFVIHQSYRQISPTVDHFDLYRMDVADELGLLDLDYFSVVERAKAQNGFVFVEWPERSRPIDLLSLDEKLKFTLEIDRRTVSFLP